MARGHPDFGATTPRELTTPLLDSGELAARLGSPVVYDRLGTVIALYTADQPVALVFEANVGSGRRDTVLAHSPFGPYAWRFTAEADGQQPGIRLLVPYIGDSPVGVEVVFRTVDHQGQTIQLTVLADTAAARSLPGIRWNEDTNRWQNLDSSGMWQNTPSSPAPLQTTLWHSLKLIFDPPESEYGQAKIDGEPFGLDGVAAESVAGFTRTLEIGFHAEGTAAATVSTDVAAVIVTVNEL